MPWLLSPSHGDFVPTVLPGLIGEEKMEGAAWEKTLPPVLPHPLHGDFGISRASAWPRGHGVVAHPRSMAVAGRGRGLARVMPACHHKTRDG